MVRPAAQHIDLLGLGGAALLMFLLSLYQLGHFSFWRDEIASVRFASAPLSELLTIIDRDRSVADVPFMATYTLLLHFWLWIADTEAQIRFLSLLAGVATTAPIYFIGRRIGGWLAGTLSAFAFAAAPYAIEWNQEARSYSLAMLASASLTLLLLRALERPTVLRWLLYGVVAAVSLYVHFFVGLVLAAHGGYVLFTRSWPTARPLIAAAVPVGIAVLPFPFIAGQYGSAYGWIPDLSIHVLRNSLASLAGGIPVLVAIAALAVAAVVSQRRDRRIWLLLAAALLPIAVAIGVSVLRPMLLPRYLVVCLPFMALLAGIGLAAIRPRAARLAAGVAMAALLALSLPSAYADDRAQDWRSAGAYIAAASQPGDRFVAKPWGGRELRYYLDRADTDAVPRSIPIAEAIDGGADRLWVVSTNQSDAEQDLLLHGLSRHYEAVASRDFGTKVTVVLMNRRQ